MTTTTKPDVEPEEMTIIQEWLKANGIDETIPEQPTFTVDAKHIWYQGFQFVNGERGRNHDKLRCTPTSIMVEDRFVPMTEPLTDKVRQAFAELKNHPVERFRAVLDEHPNTVFNSDL